MTLVTKFCKDCLYFRPNNSLTNPRDRIALGMCFRFLTKCKVTGEWADSYARVSRDYECRGRYWTDKNEKREL